MVEEVCISVVEAKRMKKRKIIEIASFVLFDFKTINN